MSEPGFRSALGEACGGAYEAAGLDTGGEDRDLKSGLSKKELDGLLFVRFVKEGEGFGLGTARGACAGAESGSRIPPCDGYNPPRSSGDRPWEKRGSEVKLEIKISRL